MESDSLKTWLYVALGAAAVYLIYQAISKVGAPLVNAVGAGVNAVTSGAANAYVAMTAPPAAQVTGGSVIMPDGSSFPSSNLTSMGIQSSSPGSVTFQSGGQTYQLAPSDAGGNYSAMPVNGLGALRYRRRTIRRER